ncbi:cytochrome P450 307a1-like [Eurosta solidaginis]|uniref:cytochrome P450 307a1-like n=1 Tax=Eurosta solidaginis TaxID=178769 RepID=UPI0035308F27
MFLFCGYMITIVFISYLITLYEHIRKIRLIKNGGRTQNLEIYPQAPGPFPWPLFGNLHLLASKNAPIKSLSVLAIKFGGIYSLTLGSTRCVVISNLELIREVLNQNGKFFGGRPNFIRYHKLFGGDRNNSLALCDWSILQKRRRNLARRYCSPRISSPHFMKMSKIGCLETDILMGYLSKNIKDGKPVYIKYIIQRTCANMFFRYMCSIHFDHTDREFCEVVRLFDQIFWEINQGYILDFLTWLSPFYKNHLDKISNWSSKIRSFILQRIINKREQPDERIEDDFTGALLKSLNDDENMSRDKIIYMLEDFIGGHSAVGNVVMLTLMYLAKNQSVAKKIQSEVDLVARNNGRRTISFYDIDSMPYTMATIYEVLRCSSSPIVPHVATKHTAIAGYGIAKGTIVFINNYALNHDKLFWKKPYCFHPERFLEQAFNKSGVRNAVLDLGRFEKFDIDKSPKNSRIKKNISYFLPFSIGKRTCIGQNLVRGFGFILVANILSQYDINYESNSVLKIKTGSIALLTDSEPLVLTKR